VARFSLIHSRNNLHYFVYHDILRRKRKHKYYLPTQLHCSRRLWERNLSSRMFLSDIYEPMPHLIAALAVGGGENLGPTLDVVFGSLKLGFDQAPAKLWWLWWHYAEQEQDFPIFSRHRYRSCRWRWVRRRRIVLLVLSWSHGSRLIYVFCRSNVRRFWSIQGFNGENFDSNVFIASVRCTKNFRLS
jgi:hypothetical protein